MNKIILQIMKRLKPIVISIAIIGMFIVIANLLPKVLDTDDSKLSVQQNDSIFYQNDSIKLKQFARFDKLAKIKSTEDKMIERKRDSAAKINADKYAELTNPWKINNFVDDFTGNKYICFKDYGTFSNSATSNSVLGVKIIIDNDATGIFLHEYGFDNPAEKTIGSFTINMKNESGEIIKLITSEEWNHTGGLKIHDYNGTYYKDLKHYKLVNFIKKSKGKIKVYIIDTYSSSYKFNIDATGFTKRYNQI